MAGRHSMKFAAMFAMGLATSIAAVSFAQAQSPANRVRVRGTVDYVDGSTLSVRTPEGATVKVGLNPDWTISSVAKAALTDIKPGDYVGVLSVPKSAGGDGAVQVFIFPPALKGTAEGSFPSSQRPNGSMTNATVSDVVKDVKGRELTLTYMGQRKKMSIPEGTSILAATPADKFDLVIGADVVVTSEKAADGSLTSSRVVVGTKGVVPPA